MKKLRIAIIGLGSVGSRVAEMLVRLGASRLTLVDKDRIELSNLNRQIFSSREVGKPKVSSLTSILMDINPFIDIRAIGTGLNATNVHEIVRKSDVIIDTMDRYVPKVILHRVARRMGRPVIHATYLEFKASVTSFTPNSISYEELMELPTRDVDLHEIVRHPHKWERKIDAYRRSIMKRYCSLMREYRVNTPNPDLITVLGASLAATIAVNELVRYVRNKRITTAPKVILSDLSDYSMQIINYKQDHPLLSCLYSYYT